LVVVPDVGAAGAAGVAGAAGAAAGAAGAAGGSLLLQAAKANMASKARTISPFFIILSSLKNCFIHFPKPNALKLNMKKMPKPIIPASA
jgi:hypothetical protein